MGPVELASCAFGQSSKISYLEMASAVCAVVNGGKLLQPRVVDAILGPEGEVIETLSPVCKRQVLKPETSQIMREMMEAVVLYGGRSLLVAADDSKLMLVVKCGLTGVVGCVIYVLVSMVLKQTIIADTIKKFKK